MFWKRALCALALTVGCLSAQSPCANTPAFSACEIAFELTDAEAAQHPNPYATVNLQAEFRSPRFKTYLMPAYWDGGRRMVIRFAPTEAGEWIYRLSGNLESWSGKTGTFTAAASEAPGYLRPANLHHWAYVDKNLAHLWMGDFLPRMSAMDETAFRALVDARAAAKFTHIGGVLMEDAAALKGDRPDVAHFQKLDKFVRYINEKGMVADLALAGPNDQLTKMLPEWSARERFVRYVVGRYAPMNITWMGVRDFETYADGRALMKEIGMALKKTDPYQHPRSSGAAATSGPLAEDGWMNFVTYRSGDDALGAIEHQVIGRAQVNQEFAPEGADAATFRRRLWNATMNGQYPASVNVSPENAKVMKAWFEFFDDTRHWELEPYFDVDNGRAVALDGVEYVVYVEKPGPVEVLVEKHGYDVSWFNPATGESIRAKKFKGERYTGEPPDSKQDWVLYIAREGKKEGMLKSYKFESRETQLQLQDVERTLPKMPFTIEAPEQDTLSLRQAVPFAAKVTRETRATRAMTWLWTGDATVDGKGYRVLATTQKGVMQIPQGIAKKFPAVLNLRVYGMNSNGKVYSLDKTYQVTP